MFRIPYDLEHIPYFSSFGSSGLKNLRPESVGSLPEGKGVISGVSRSMEAGSWARDPVSGILVFIHHVLYTIYHTLYHLLYTI